MARLNEACEGLIAALEKASAELQWVSNKLEEEFSAQYKGRANPMDLLERINKLKRCAR
jgi:hypothetical protein